MCHLQDKKLDACTLNMKILFIGDYSNLHTTLARELNRMGHQAHVLSDRCGHMNLQSDFFLKREKGILGGFKYLYDIFSLLPKLKDYDVVQLINTNFLSLRPQKIKYFFDILKKQNGSVFLTLAGNDYYFCKACNDAKMFRFSEFKIGNSPTPAHAANPHHLYNWLSHSNKLWAEYLFANINGAISVAPEYDMAARDLLGDRLLFSNLPVDFSELPSPVSFQGDKVNILLGMRSGFEDSKGTKTLYKIAKEIESQMPEMVNINLAKDLPLKDFLDLMSKSDIVLDQLYSYSPGMTAIYAMALGKAVATGAQPEYYQYIGNPIEKPLIPLSPFDTDIQQRLISLIHNRNEIISRGEQGKRLAHSLNAAPIVAAKYLSHVTGR